MRSLLQILMGFLFVSNLTHSGDENRRTLLVKGASRYTLFQEGLESFQEGRRIDGGSQPLFILRS